MNIVVNWLRPSFGAEHQGVYDFPPVNLASGEGVDRRLGFPVGTTAILNHAFENRLKRFQLWRMASSYNCRDAFFHAASIFRRGVPAQYGEEQLRRPEHSGRYSISEEKFPSNRRGQINETFYVVDQAVAQKFPEIAKLTPAFKLTAIEAEKTLETVSKITQAWRSSGAHSHWVIIGGGLTADVGAFAADLTGSKFSLVPTTLLALVDACVGGKTGVNYLHYGKNQIGRFAFPESVVIDRRFLRSLSDRDFRSGISECLKHAILAGNDLWVEQLTAASAKMDRELSTVNLEEFIRYKAKIVELDPDERGVRAVLNFGHTFGHAIETLAILNTASKMGPILHGEAVAAGMIFALLVSRDVGDLDRAIAADLIGKIVRSHIIPETSSFLQAAGIDPTSENSSWEKILQLLLQDKKNSVSIPSIEFVLISALGRPISTSGKYTVSVPVDTVRLIFKEFLQHLTTC